MGSKSADSDCADGNDSVPRTKCPSDRNKGCIVSSGSDDEGTTWFRDCYGQCEEYHADGHINGEYVTSDTMCCTTDNCNTWNGGSSLSSGMALIVLVTLVGTIISI